VNDAYPCEYGSVGRWRPDRIRLDPPLLNAWSPPPGESFVDTPLLGFGLAFCVSRQRGLVALEAWNGNVRWQMETERAWGTAQLVGDRLFTTPRGGNLSILDALTGSTVESHSVEGIVLAYAVVVDRVVVSPVANESMGAWDCDKRDFAWRVPTRWAATPIAAGNGVVCVSEQSSCVALDLATGQERWRFDASALGRHKDLWGEQSGEIVGHPVVAKDTTYVAVTGGSLVALGTAEGTVRWKAKVDDFASHNFSLTPDGALSVLTQDALIVLDAATGVARARHKLAAADRDVAGPFGPMSVTERFVWAVDKRRRLVAISRDDGRIAWRTEVGNLVGSAPAIGDGRLFLTDVDGRLLAYTSAEEAW